MFKVAIIDDNRATVEMIATTINWAVLGCTVCGTVYDGLRGKALIRQQLPDIIIADIHMPGMDGLEMIKGLHEERPEAKVIFLSAYDDFSYAQKALQYHAHEFLVKPLEREKLIASIERAILESGRAADANEATSAEDRTLVDNMLEYIHAHPIHPTLQELSDHFGFSPSYIGTLIKRETGQNFMDLVMDVRICHAKKLLKEPTIRIDEVAQAVGYKNYISFYKMFTKCTGMSPREYRNSGKKA